MKARRLEEIRERAFVGRVSSEDGRQIQADLRDLLMEFDLLTAEIVSANRAILELEAENKRLRENGSPRRSLVAAKVRYEDTERSKAFGAEMERLRASLEISSRKRRM